MDQSLDPDQAQHTLIDYKKVKSKEEGDALYELFTMDKTYPNPLISVIFKNKTIPIRIEVRVSYSRRLKKGESNVLKKLYVNCLLDFSLRSHSGIVKRRLTKKLGKSNKLGEFIYWKNEKNISTLFTIPENKDNTNTIVIDMFDKNYYSLESVINNVLLRKGIDLKKN